MWKLSSRLHDWVEHVAVTKRHVFLTTRTSLFVTDLCGNHLRVWPRTFFTIHAIAAVSASNVVFVSADGVIEAFRNDGTFLRRIQDRMDGCFRLLSTSLSTSNKHLFAALVPCGSVQVYSFDGLAVFAFACKGSDLAHCDGELFAMEPTHTGCTVCRVHVHAAENGMSLRLFTLDNGPWSTGYMGISVKGNLVIAEKYSRTYWTTALDGSRQQKRGQEENKENTTDYYIAGAAFDVQAVVSALVQQ